jgi:hypothetical protein
MPIAGDPVGCSIKTSVWVAATAPTANGRRDTTRELQNEKEKEEMNGPA